MNSTLRKSPPICLIISLYRLAIGKLRLSDIYLGQSVLMDDGNTFKVFRHISIKNIENNKASIVFVVNFKFARLSHKANKKASIIPMLLITGFPGFVTKIYAVNPENGYWQGMYQWKSLQHLEEYKKSFVFKVMNKRAIPESIHSFEIENKKLSDFIEEKRH